MSKYRKAMTSQPFIIRTNDDGSECWIPQHTANSDYQAYLAWVAEGNTAEEWNPQG